MAEHHKQLHVAMFPWLAFGHIIPFFEVAKLIAQKGHRISFISTPRNIQRLPYVPPDLSKLINLVSVPLPHEDNLPPDAEATMDIPHHTVPYLKKAFDGLHQGLANFLQDSTPDWIIYDFAPHWLGPIAESLGISRAFFNIFNAATLGFFAPSTSSMINGDDSRKEPKHFTVPPPWVPFPSNVAFRLHEAKRILDHLDENPSGATDGFRAGSVIAGCEVLVIRSCMELEPQWLRLCSHLHGKPIVPIGLLPPSLPVDKDTVDETWQTISQWLDKQNKGSVVYIAMGSELSLSQDNITELALGLELSGLPFFWVLRKQNASADSDSVELPDGFTERIKDRGIVWTSWAPQLRTLAHESIGGFLTHCGWSSIIEGLSFGRALIMLPFAIDQGLNARIFEEKKTGIEVPRNEQDGSFTRTSLAESLRLVLVEDEGKIYRENAVEMSKMFGNKNLHDRYMKDFIRYLEKHKTGTQEETEEMT